jgi:hypothetical protein
MPIPVLIHIMNEDPVLGEVEQLPGPADTNLLVNNPRRKDGKDVSFLLNSVTQVVWPISRIAFIEVLPGEEGEKIIGFVRE